jgi:acetyl-CoA carboxylase biotin carboxyl carrier protein
MDIRKIKTLIELVKDSDIAEIEVTEGEETVKISRLGSHSLQMMATQPVQAVATPIPVAVTPTANTPDTTTPQVTQPPPSDDHMVKSPMVGTFYGSPSPNSKAFVQVGQQVSDGDILCIIEAMKIMNQIEADKSGTITAILVEDAQPIEFGQPLFSIG